MTPLEKIEEMNNMVVDINKILTSYDLINTRERKNY